MQYGEVMNEAIRMQISAFVDGELPDNESELLLRRLCQDAAMRSQVAAYLAIGRALRGDEEPAGMATLRTRIGEALGEEVVQSPAVNEEKPARFLRPIAGVGIAASVAMVALIGLRQVEPVGEIEPGTLEDLSAVAIDGGPSYTEPPVVDTLSDRPSDMLTQYYLRHGQQSPNLGSRLVGLEVRQDRLVDDDAEERATADDSPAESEDAESREENGPGQ